MSEAKETVFLVDDDASVLKGLRRLLAAAGLQAAAFESPQQFLEHYDPPPRAASCSTSPCPD
jgi:FixJ family two-component response regulator